ncbi:MAG TPA: MMPL family transporter [Solirubrobacterales bacterium]|nr:MMPL family transporter [Solirubrobacterales bacterium]
MSSGVSRGGGDEGGRTPLSLRHPRALLAVAFVAIAALAVVAQGVEDKLRPTSLSIPGTESSRANDLLHRHFGDTAPFAILLQGPPAQLDEQGPELIRALRTDPAVSTLSPWDRGSVARLRPGPRKALIIADFHVDAEDAVKETVPYLEQTLEERISPPVRATQTGFASLSKAIQDESVDSTERAELIAIPILLIVLLLVFRSPIAAAIPLAFGAVTVNTSRGLISIAADWISIDAFALTVCAMMGLALGVDYALLMVSRFREELEAGAAPLEAARMTRRTAGRTTAFAGSTLFLAMLVTLAVMPGKLLLSLAGTAIVVTGISVLVAALIGPALLVVVGHNVNRWRLGSHAAEGTGVMAMVGAALKRPKLAVLLIGALVLLLAAPVLAVKTGPPSAEQLPASNPARQDAERIARAAGPGWDAPFVLVAVADRGQITDERRLGALKRWQERIAEDPGVQAVIGPGQIEERVEPLQEGGNDLLAGRGEADPERFKRLGTRLGGATDGVRQLRTGIEKASYGAGLLATGSGRAGSGAEQIEGGLARAVSGAERAGGALDQLADGSGKLAEGQRQAQLGALSIESNAGELLRRVRDSALTQARNLQAELKERAAADPSLAEEAREAERLVENLAIARNDAQRIHGLSGQLRRGQTRLADGGAKLHKGAERLANAAGELPTGLERLRGGTSQLVDGLERLKGGADTLEQRLAEGFQRSQPLQTGLRRASVRVSVSANRFERRVDRLRRSSPGIFDSGYFVLSALQGAPDEERKQVGRVVDLENGGQAAQMVVIPRFTFNTPGSIALNGRLKEDADGLAVAAGVNTGVTGGAAELIDYTDTITERIPIVIAVISIATFLILVVILRAIPLAAIAVALNLVTVAVAFGILTLLFEVPEGWPLGGRNYVDAIGAAGIFGIVFGLSIDYAVFLLMRMREHYENGASNEEAIAFGLERTARVITGAAAIMAAVFIAFAGAPIATVSQLGIGLTVAVLLDATVIRIVLLPALMLLLGDRVWWLPPSLQRILPEIDLHGSRAG